MTEKTPGPAWIRYRNDADMRAHPAVQLGTDPEVGDITNVDYANSRARANPVRSFSQVVPRFTAEELERAYRSCGVIFKGVNKKSRDAFRKGFTVIPDIEDRELTLELNAAVRDWMRSTAYMPKAIQALREMFVFGDGFLELGYAEPKGTKSSAAPSPSAEIVAVFNVDPFSILPVRDPYTGEVKAYLAPEGIGPTPPPMFDPTQPSQIPPPLVNVRAISRLEVQRWARGEGPLPRGVQAIHPKRIQHFQVNAIREHPDGLGISIIEPAYINALAKLAGDLAAGDVLEWYSKGFFTLNIEYATPEELVKGQQQIEAAKNARKNYFVGSERSKFDIKSPNIANVKQFYDNFYTEIAAALEMPVMILLGVQKGTVTGSETDLAEYYDDIHAFQRLMLEAPMLEILRRVLRRADISIEWTPLYVNKQTEADITFKRSQSAGVLFGNKILSRREVIRFLRNGELPNPEEVPDGYSQGPAPSNGSAPADGTAPAGGDTGSPQHPDPNDDAEDEDEMAVDPDEVARLHALGLEIMRQQGDLAE